MVPPENPISLAGQHALQDMVELQMYLVAQAPYTPWPMFPRRLKAQHERRKPHANPVESDAVKELTDRGFIEATSSTTFVVSKAGYQYYEGEIKPRISA